MNADFNWWLLVVGLVIGAGLAWLVLADLGSLTDPMESAGRADDAAWIARRLRSEGRPMDTGTVAEILRLRDSRSVVPSLPAAEPEPPPEGPVPPVSWAPVRPDRDLAAPEVMDRPGPPED